MALKFLPDDVARNPQALARFQREAQAASALNHPNICTIHEIGQQDGRPFIVMEFLDGVTLKHRIAGKPLENDVLLASLSRSPTRSMLPTRKASCTATSNRPTFSDQARPRKNSRLRTGKGHAGSQPTGSKQREQRHRQPPATDEHLTSPGSTLGTVAYMSPEQVRAKELDARSDLFLLRRRALRDGTGASCPFAEKAQE